MEEEIGVVEHYFNHISVAAITLTKGSLQVGDTIHVVGATTDFTQPVRSMEIDRQQIDHASPGQSIGIKTTDRVREGDVVYKVTS
ncbi:MAG: EF-Tu/IF-2/RF-3 family GTPase [Candidatus Thermoplasmatota archaeon]|nr:EF-Tu/IF-2/RF-3 family GTPase [Candidatus Thermoplasmatota archaeon]